MTQKENPFIFYPLTDEKFMEELHHSLSTSARVFSKKELGQIIKRGLKYMVDHIIEEPKGVLVPPNYFKIAIVSLIPRHKNINHDAKDKNGGPVQFANLETGGLVYTTFLLQNKSGKLIRDSWQNAKLFKKIISGNYMKKRLHKKIISGDDLTVYRNISEIPKQDELNS